MAEKPLDTDQLWVSCVLAWIVGVVTCVYSGIYWLFKGFWPHLSLRAVLGVSEMWTPNTELLGLNKIIIFFVDSHFIITLVVPIFIIPQWFHFYKEAAQE